MDKKQYELPKMEVILIADGNVDTIGDSGGVDEGQGGTILAK